MTTTTEPTGARFRQLLSTRATLGPQGAMGPPPRPAGQRPIYEFGGGRPDPASFPYQELVSATAEMMEVEGAEALTYGDAQGYAGLRELVARKYELFEGLQVSPENILISNGSGHAISLVISAFIDIGDPVICEAPTFMGTLNTLRRHGAEVHEVPLDDEGIVTEAVRERLEALRGEGRPCKLIYTMPTFHNPAGPTMSLRRRRELVALAGEYGTLILEDDAYGDLRFEGEALPSLYALDESGGTVRTGTLSKILGAGMRLGWACASRELIQALQSFNFGGGVSPFSSRVATYYMRENMREHVALLVDVYREKRDTMLRGLREGLDGTEIEINHPEGGFFLWLKLPAGADPAQVRQLANESGVQYVPGTACFAKGGGADYIRLAFSYEPAERCYEGAKLLGQAIRRVVSRES
jgi:2-aminoadipate transaminase